MPTVRCCKPQENPPPCPLPVVSCFIEEVSGQPGVYVLRYTVVEPPGYPVTAIWLVESCPDVDPVVIPLPLQPLIGSYQPVDIDCDYTIYARNICGIVSSDCTFDGCPDCEPCSPKGCVDPYCGQIECCDPLWLDIRLDDLCGGNIRLSVDPNRSDPCTETWEVFRDSAFYATITWRWYCKEDGTIVFQVIYTERLITDDSIICQKFFEKEPASCKCPRDFKGDVQLIETSSEGTCNGCGATVVISVNAYFPEIEVGCCEVWYDEETCTFCWECNQVDRVDIVTPVFEGNVGNIGERQFPRETADQICIRSYYRNETCVEQYCKLPDEPCCVDRECSCVNCGDAVLPDEGTCRCFDPVDEVCKTLPSVQIDISGVEQAENPTSPYELDCDDLNGTFVSPNNDGDSRCGGFVYADTSPSGLSQHSIQVEYPVWLQRESGTFDCFLVVTIESTYQGIGNVVYFYFNWDYEAKVWNKWSNPDVCGAETFQCYDCSDFVGALPFDSRCYQGSVISPPGCRPGGASGTQEVDPCNLASASVSVTWLP